MRVGVVLDQVDAPVPGGTGRYARELADALVTRAPSSGQVEGWTSWRRPGHGLSVGGRAARRMLLPRRLLTRAWALGLPPQPSGVDLVHAPTLQAPSRGRVPLVVTVHDAVPWTHPETLTPHGARWHRMMGERVASSADLVVVPTMAVAAQLSRHLSISRVEVVGEGVSGRLTLPVDAETRARRLGLPEGFFVTLATLEPRKGLDVLIQALARRSDVSLPLMVVGQAGWGGVDPGELTRAAGLPSDRVHLLGRLADEDLAVVLARATCLVMPSRAEGFGLPVLEAMHSGTAVITSDDPALVEVGGGATRTSAIGDPEALGEVLAEVAADADLRSEMSLRGRKVAATQTWAAAADRLWDLYRDLLDASSSVSTRSK